MKFGLQCLNGHIIWCQEQYVFHLAPLPPFSFGTTPSFFIWHHSVLFHLAPLPPFSFGTTPSFFIWHHSLLFHLEPLPPFSKFFWALCPCSFFAASLALSFWRGSIFHTFFYFCSFVCACVRAHTCMREREREREREK